MTAKRSYTDEILSIRGRNESSARSYAHLLRLSEIERAFDKAKEGPAELLRYFPMGLIAYLEGILREIYRELIDSGSPYLDNVEKLKDLRLDSQTIVALHKRTITTGELIAHLLPCNTLESISSNMSMLTGRDFLDEIQRVHDRVEVEVLHKTLKPIIEDAPTVFSGVSRTFELRHILAHELASALKLDVPTITNCISAMRLFIQATEQFVSNLLYPGAPLTQSEMNIVAGNDFQEANEALDALMVELNSRLQPEERELLRKSQESWEAYREMQANLVADMLGKGGTIWPLEYSSVKRSLTEERTKNLRGLLEYDKILFVRPEHPTDPQKGSNVRPSPK